MTPNSNNNSSDFLKTDGGETESNAIEIPSISLPKGGGAIKGIDEKFSVNTVNGTSSFAIPLPFSSARGASPSLSLSYNSGGGNGIFGLGWNVGLSSIQRKTAGGLPQYIDSIDSDTFLFSEAEDLVAEFKKLGDGSFEMDADDNYIINEKDSVDGLFTIRYYRPRIEGLFARIERWFEKSTERVKWKVTTKENVVTLFGWTDNSVISNPNDLTKIYKWFPEFVFDDRGNCTHYLYEKENELGFNNSLIHNKNRYKDGKVTYTNLYLDKILYGNITAYKLGDTFPLETDYMFQTVFDYGTVLPNESPDTLEAWDFRPDAFSDYKAGFEIRTTRLCKRVLLFHVFDELALKPDKSDKKTLIQSINFEYDTTVEQDFTFLKSITSNGYIKKPDGSYSQKMLPPFSFEYQTHEWSNEVKTISPEDMVHAPSGLEGGKYQFTDLYNEGLNGILTEQANGWYYKHNLGDGKFQQAKLVKEKPSFVGLGDALQLVDLEADGGKQLVSYSDEYPGYFELEDDNEWQRFRAFNDLPNIDFGDDNIRMLDLNGDGKPEVVVTEDNMFTWYLSEGKNGFSEARKSVKFIDEEEGPHIVFADGSQSIFLADMSGDGMTDIVRVRNGEVCYWANLGYGKFGAKTSMDNAPLFDFQGSFNPAYLKLADIDGSGTTDIVYLGKNKFTCWKNLSGNRFSSTPFEIDSFPEIHSQSGVSVTDLLGEGVACILWSSSLTKDLNSPLKYIDLLNGKKPHIMVSYKNNLGKEVSIDYTPSTKFYLDDKQAGKQWATKLNFPVHCISKTTTEDKVSGYKFVSEYKYHHGYFDHSENEFRGFGMVEQIDAETFEHWVKSDATNIVEEPLHQEPVITKTWHHTGAFLGKDRILNQFKEDYWYAEMEREGFPVDHYEVDLPDTRLVAAQGLDSALIDQLTGQEWKEALRACKGTGLRSEIFARDAVKYDNTIEACKKEHTPYAVSTRNYVVELVQPKGQNKHAIFVMKESETINYSYERNAEDPRINHNLNIKLDAYGNVLESAAMVYPRMIVDSSLPTETQQEQSKTVIIYTENQFTNDVILDDAYRLRLSSEQKNFELKGVPKSDDFYSLSDFENILENANSDVALYHETNLPPEPGKAQRRLIEHVRTIYCRNDLSGALPLHQMEYLALPFENYQLAYTPELVTDIFETKVNAPLLTEGKFTHSEGDNNWWICSGTTQYTEGDETAVTAQNRFYVPVSYTDPYGAVTRVKYHSNYYLIIEETEDALGNKAGVELINFRTLSPRKMMDVNGNSSEVICDEIGMVKAMSLMGKGTQADELAGISEHTDASETALIQSLFNAPDSVQLTAIAKSLLQHATFRFVYDYEAYFNQDRPAAVAVIARETHYRKPDGSLNPESKIQVAFEYSNGLGEVVMKKAQTRPGEAKEVTVNPDNTIVINTIDTAASNPQQLRWIGSGRTIKDNKGNPVKEYEPYFSTTPHYEDFKELVETGVTPKLFYDPLGRLIKTEMPDGTFSKVEFDSWKQAGFDANDTILESSWYENRTNRLIDEQLIAEGKDPGREKLAADQAALHDNTPNILHFDTLGRPVLSVEHNKDIGTQVDEFYHTNVKLDVEGNLRTITDARGNASMQYKYDMLGNQVYQHSMDAGQRWLLTNILSNPLRSWDERGHEFQYFYDTTHRATYSKVVGGDGATSLDNIYDKVVYGESLLLPDRANEAELKAKNVLGKIISKYDTGGVIETSEYDLLGQLVSTNRKLFKKYKEVANWTEANLVNDLELDDYIFSTETDALGRITKQTAPDLSIITPTYDEGGLLNSESVLHPGTAEPSVYIQNIDYNEKGQRNKIDYGNNVSTQFYYDKETFQLKRLESKRQNGDPLQDFYYTYDPVGNITHIEDKNIPVTFFDNQKVTGIAEYTYDALYRLVEASGRENNAALSFNGCDNWNDKSFMSQTKWGDPMAVRNYTQSYQYDPVGNIEKMKHLAAGGNWTRSYDYETLNNRLKGTQIGDNGNPANYTKYAYHAKHEYLEELPHLEKIGWNFKEEVVLTSRQQCTEDNIPVITYYQYDGEGQRIRKITENQVENGGEPTKKEERIYVSTYELYKKHSGPNAGLERVSLSITDQDLRFVMIETRNDIDDGTEKQLVRYQLYNHLGSSSMELDGTFEANVISYEEYHPYGTTAYQANNKDIKAAAKRYRYTGMERDEETGLEYHSARYYMPWLGRWLSADPLYKLNYFRSSDSGVGKENGKNGSYNNARTDNNRPGENKRSHRDLNENLDKSDEGPLDREQLKNPLISQMKEIPDHESSTILKSLNLYAYGALNPVVYHDPTGLHVMQAWSAGYDNAEAADDTAGMVGYGFLFIFAWIAHVIVNLFILVVAITILNPAGGFGILDFSWGGIQGIIGLVFGVIMVLFGASVTPAWGQGAQVELPAYMGGGWGVSFGAVTLGTDGFTQWEHENGHRWQSRLLGPFYLFVVGIPSAAGAQWTEDWANDWAT